MAFSYVNKQTTCKLLKLCHKTLQAALIPPVYSFSHACRPKADSKVTVGVDHKRTEVNLQSFVSALKSVDSNIKTVKDIANFNKLDWMKISDPFFVALVQSWEEVQNKLKKKLIVDDTEEWAKAIDGDEEKGIKGLQYIGGVDVSFVKDNPYVACAAYVILKYPSLCPVYSNTKTFELTVPYICGFLAFREITPYQELIREQRLQHPELGPDVIMVDGNGLLHSKGFGMACHLGVLLDIPCIGVAKNLLLINDIQMVGDLKTQCKNLKGGEKVALVGESGTVYGMALKSTDSTREIYVSSGYKVSLETAVNVVTKCCKYRIPEPIRHADHLSRVHLRSLFPETNSVPKVKQKTEAKGMRWLIQYTSIQPYRDIQSLVKKTTGILFSKYYHLRIKLGLSKKANK